MDEYKLAEKHISGRNCFDYQRGLCATGLKDFSDAQKCFQSAAQSDRSAGIRQEAERALSIVSHNFVNPSNDD
ncbi:hypothetical protein Q0P93_15500, partial [Staphylococcus aureus]|nr:hypothetical protein [Staphylococcus aureus]